MGSRQLFTYQDLTLEYAIFGSGPGRLLYFHGYGKSADEFGDYQMDLGKEYTIYSFNFFHHGGSQYPANRIDHHTLTAFELAAIVKAFLQKNNIQRFSLMGYSMGGKICLSLLEQMGERVDKLILVAPDGVKRNFWYHFASNNRMGRAMYRKIIQRPRFFFSFIHLLRKVRLLDARLHDFVCLHLETEEKRAQVYRVWMTLSKINPNVKQLTRTIQEQKIGTCLNYGRYDRVIGLKQGQKLFARTQPWSRLNVLEKGHKMANAQTGALVAAFLKQG